LKSDTSGSVATSALAVIGPIPGSERRSAQAANCPGDSLRRERAEPMQALRGVIRLGIGADISCQFVDLSLRVHQLIGQQVQGLASRRGKVRPVAGRNQAVGVLNALGQDDAEFAQMRPDRIHASRVCWRTRNSRALRRRRTYGATWVMSRACLPALLTGTKRIDGRDTASQIASASAWSVLPRLTYPLT